MMWEMCYVEVDGTLEMYALLSLDLRFSVFKIRGGGAGIFLKLPDVTLTLGVEFGKPISSFPKDNMTNSYNLESAGVCGGKDYLGVKVLPLMLTCCLEYTLKMVEQRSGQQIRQFSRTNWSTPSAIAGVLETPCLRMLLE